jgi:hypothetical protein
MRRSIQILLLAVSGLVIAWQYHRHMSASQELASVEAQAAAQRTELESRRAALAAAVETNAATLEGERLAGNERLLPLMRERAAATQAASDAAAKTQGMGSALAKALDDSDPSQVERDYQRKQTRANLDVFFKLANLSPEKADRYVDLEVEMKRRQDERMAGLTSGTLSVADAVRQRDEAYQEQQDQRREILGPDGWATLQGIADGMRNGAAKNLTSAVQANMGNNPLTPEQSDRLQSVIKAEVTANTMDDTDLFRPVAEWTQMVTDREQHVLQVASEFLTPAQQQTLQFLEGENLKQLLQQREQRIKTLGIKR